MYRGFNLELIFDNEKYYQIGLNLFNKNKSLVERTLKSFITIDGSLNGTKMQNNWFPQIDVDVFISHSHTDNKGAITLAGWLYETFGIKSFIDSCIWGYSDDLLWQIDSKFCYNDNSDTFDYRKRNQTTSHVHMMLSTALSMMMDKTECLFFLNTPNSISISESITQTSSPWIYAEIATTQILRKNIPQRIISETKTFSKAEEFDNFETNYDVGEYIEKLTNLNVKSLIHWQDSCKLLNINNNPKRALDVLYHEFTDDKSSLTG